MNSSWWHSQLAVVRYGVRPIADGPGWEVYELQVVPLRSVFGSLRPGGLTLSQAVEGATRLAGWGAVGGLAPNGTLPPLEFSLPVVGTVGADGKVEQ